MNYNTTFLHMYYSCTIHNVWWKILSIYVQSSMTVACTFLLHGNECDISCRSYYSLSENVSCISFMF